MPSNLYNQLNNSSNNPAAMLQKFREFANSFQGDPQQMVMQLLQSGRMSQGQYDQLSRMATQFQNFLRKL